jgi:hypothetical protein
VKEAFFYINDGGEISNPKVVRKAFKLNPGRYKLTIEECSKRTLPQNAWFHAVLPYILRGLRDAGFNEVKDVHDAKAVVKSLFFKRKITNGIETIDIIEGTSAQTKINFAEKATDIIDWAAQYLEIDIAPPSSQIGIHQFKELS